MTKNRLFWEPGIGSRSEDFSHAGMTHWGVFGARAAPKSICTHQAHRLKKIDEKGDFYGQMAFCVPNVRKSFLGRADRKNLLIYPFRPQNIHILSIRPLEHILWLCENGSQNRILGKNSGFAQNLICGLCTAKIQGFEGENPENRLFGAWFWKYITFVWEGVIQQYLYSIKVWYESLFSPRRTPSMCTHQAQPSVFLICG